MGIKDFLDYRKPYVLVSKILPNYFQNDYSELCAYQYEYFHVIIAMDLPF